MSLIKTKKISTLLIGHVNKEGNLAGPKVLEHLVDAVFLLEGERDQSLRLLRSVKNRYGTVNEVGMFEMDSNGLQELRNPAEKNSPKSACKFFRLMFNNYDGRKSANFDGSSGPS